MPKKIYELASELNLGALDLVEQLRAKGFNIRNHMTSLTDEELDQAMKAIKPAEAKASKVVKKKVTKKRSSKLETNMNGSSEGETVQLSPEDANAKSSAAHDAEEDEENKKSKLVRRKTVVRKKVEVDEEEIQEEVQQEPQQQQYHQEELNVQEESELLAVEIKEDSENISSSSFEENSDLIQSSSLDVPNQEQPQYSIETPEASEEKTLSASAKEDEVDDDFNPGNELENPSIANIEKNIETKLPPKQSLNEPVVSAPRGLRVVSRPRPEVKKVAEESEVVAPVEKKREYLDEKMHTFTPVFIPPKKTISPVNKAGGLKPNPDVGAGNASGVIRRVISPRGTAPSSTGPGYSGHGGAGFEQKIIADQMAMKGGLLRPRITDHHGASPEGSESDAESKKRISDLAAMVAKPKAVKRDMEQLRADEELRTYADGIIGKVLYTTVGKKKVYVGATKETQITEVKDSKRVISFYKSARVSELAQKLNCKFSDLRDKALEANLLLKEDDYLGLKLLKKIAALYNYRVEDSSFDESAILGESSSSDETHDVQETLHEETSSKKANKKVGSVRPPVVTIMGHVDHGKTTLLDYIRKAKVAEGEAGGITQHVGAYSVNVAGKGSITFLDTPGHAAFGSMRERGAKLTDIVVLVVAADDGVMPQTKESIRFCQQQGVAIIVAVNKMDKPDANPDRIKQELMEFQLTPEEWGGETQYVLISALKGEGIDNLLEGICIQAEMMELAAETKGQAKGIVIESNVETGRGPITTVLIQSGTLNVGDALVVGVSHGRARSIMETGTGKSIKTAGPSTPVQILGLDQLPLPGEELYVVKNEREAKKVVDNRLLERQEAELKPMKKSLTLEDFFNANKPEGEKKLLKVILRTDFMGPFEAIKKAIEELGNDEVGVQVLGGGAGAITDSDVLYAESAEGLILSFNMRPVTSARRLAEEKGVEIKTYRIIYELINDVKMALEGMLSPEIEEKYIGRVEVREVFNIPKVGVIAGSNVVDGRIERGCCVRLLREGKIVFDGKLSNLKRFKDDVKEVKMGYECGVALEGFGDIRIGDLFEAYRKEEKKRTLPSELTM